MRWMLAFGVAASTAGCDGWISREAADIGSVCLATDDPGSDVSFQEPQVFTPEAEITVMHALCFGASCDRNMDVSIDASQTGTTLTLMTQARWEEARPRPGMGCPDMCDYRDATMSLGSLEEGEYTITFGEDTLSLTVPGTQRACLGAYPFGANFE